MNKSNSQDNLELFSNEFYTQVLRNRALNPRRVSPPPLPALAAFDGVARESERAAGVGPERRLLGGGGVLSRRRKHLPPPPSVSFRLQLPETERVAVLCLEAKKRIRGCRGGCKRLWRLPKEQQLKEKKPQRESASVCLCRAASSSEAAADISGTVPTPCVIFP